MLSSNNAATSLDNSDPSSYKVPSYCEVTEEVQEEQEKGSVTVVKEERESQVEDLVTDRQFIEEKIESNESKEELVDKYPHVSEMLNESPQPPINISLFENDENLQEPSTLPES